MENLQKEQYEYIEKIKNIIPKLYTKKPTFCVITFGCQMNAKDSEKLSGILELSGFTEIEDENVADVVIFNTCTVRENANKRLYGRIGQLKTSYMNNKKKIIGIAGCMMQEKDEVEYIKEKYPYVKLIFGTFNVFKFAELLYDVLKENKKVYEIVDKPIDIVENLPMKNKYSFKCGVNIMYGCNNFCSYCIVPYVRGRERSRNEEDIINEIKNHIKNGVKEIMLLGQNVNSYGKDLGDKNCNFKELLQNVSKIDGLYRLRFMTSHPKDFSYDLIDVIKNNKTICKHIHLPVQSGSDRILDSMNRKYTKDEYLKLVKKIKNEIENIAITTDIIVGYPQETEEDFNDTLNLVREVEFDSVFTFKYSKRTGTKAAMMSGQVDGKIVSDRFDRLLSLVKEISERKTKEYENKIMECLIEDVEVKENMYVGRLDNNYLVYFPISDKKISDVVKVKLIKSHNFYFLGEEIK